MNLRFLKTIYNFSKFSKKKINLLKKEASLIYTMRNMTEDSTVPNY